MIHHEDQIQRAFFDWIGYAVKRESALLLCFAVPNGGYRRPLEARIMKGLGVRAGVPDILLPCRGRGMYQSYIGFAMELKSEKGRLSEGQEEWRDRLVGAGWYWTLQRDFDGARREICNYLEMKP